MVHGSTGGRGRGRLLVITLMALAIVLAFAIVTQSASALSSYQLAKHSTVSMSCTSCHPGGAPNTVTNSMCTASGCHAGKVAMPVTYTLCWSCHKPGQDMTVATSAGCSATCHTLTAGTTTTYGTDFTHGATPHLGANVVGCLNCHTVASALHHAGENAVAPATCTDCHGNAAVPAAPAAPHGTLVAGITDCATCHKGMTPTHPVSAAVVTPTLTFVAKQPVGGADVSLAGTFKRGTVALVGVVVHLQSTANGTDFTDVTSVTTVAGGAFTFTVVGATPGLSYRAVAEGVAGPPVVLPAEKTAAVTAPTAEAITLKLNGLNTVTIALGKRVTARGAIAPKLILTQAVKLTVQKRRANGTWAAVTTLTTTKTASAYSKPYTPRSRGTFRMQAVLAKTVLHAKATSVWRTFKVR